MRDKIDLTLLLVIAAGGALGSLARWSVGEAFSSGHGSFPSATFLENVSGAFALGVLMVFVVDVWPPSRYRQPFLGVGVLGGFTTFSTYALDARSLLVAGRAPLAAAYVLGTLAAGLTAVWFGIFLARLATRPGRGSRPGRRSGRAEEDHPYGGHGEQDGHGT